MATAQLLTRVDDVGHTVVRRGITDGVRSSPWRGIRDVPSIQIVGCRIDDVAHTFSAPD